MASLSCLTRVRLQSSAGYKKLEPGTEFYFPLMIQDLPQSQVCSRQVDGLINQLTATGYHEDKAEQKAGSAKTIITIDVYFKYTFSAESYSVMSHLQRMPCCWQLLSQTFPHANHQIATESGSRKWEILLNLEVGQLDSNLVFTTSCPYDLEKKPFSLVRISISSSAER